MKYTHTHTCVRVHSWKRQLDLSACLYQFSSSEEKQARLLSSIAEHQKLRACVAIGLCMLWIYGENKIKIELQWAYRKTYVSV